MSPSECLTPTLAVSIWFHRRGNVHRMNNIGEQHRHLLVLRRSADPCDWCTALVTELGVGRQFGTARPTHQSRRRQRAAIVPSAVHVGIVSPLLSDVRHIAGPSPRRSFETLICRLFRDDRPDARSDGAVYMLTLCPPRDASRKISSEMSNWPYVGQFKLEMDI